MEQQQITTGLFDLKFIKIFENLKTANEWAMAGQINIQTDRV